MNTQFKQKIIVSCFTFAILISSICFAFAMEFNHLNSNLVRFDNNDKLENKTFKESPMPIEKVLYNITVPRGAGANTFLSCTDRGVVDLYNKDDQEGRQKWVFINVSGDIFNIVVSNPGESGKYLSCTDRGVVDLYDKDDNSGHQRWKLIPLPNGSFNIMSIGRYLSCNREGTVVDLYHKDDNTGRQQWVLTPEDLEIESITFTTANSTKIPKPDFIIEVLVENGTSLPQTMTASFEKAAKMTSSFEQSEGYSFEVSATTKFGIPSVAEGEITVTASTQHTWTQGKIQESSDTRKYEFPVDVPARSTVKAQAKVSQTELEVPYTVTGRSKITPGVVITSTGTWKGISLGTITYSLIEKNQ